MEILSNFSSAYCFISFILGALFMLTMLCIAAMGKVQEPMNNVHFYVARDRDNLLFLYMGKPIKYSKTFFPCRFGKALATAENFSNYGLNICDFEHLKNDDEPIEVFINMED